MATHTGGSLSAPTTVLVTSAGSAPAVAVLDALRQQQEIPVRLVAADLDPLSVGFTLSDAAALVPRAEAPGFIPRLLEICLEYGVTVLFPIIDEELLAQAEAASQFADHGIQVVTNAPDVVRTARDKWLTYQWCAEHYVLTPQTWLPKRRPPALPFPVIVKPRMGRGSVGVTQAADEAALEYWLARGQDVLIQQRITGPEYTVDILADPSGRVLSAVPRERLMTKAGMCVKGRTVNIPRLLDLAVSVAEVFRLTPRGNIQFIHSPEDGRYHLIEINPKFGAGLPLTTAAGVNMPLLILKMLRGHRLHPMIGEFENHLTMLRRWSEVFRSEVAIQPLAEPDTLAPPCIPAGR